MAGKRKATGRVSLPLIYSFYPFSLEMIGEKPLKINNDESSPAIAVGQSVSPGSSRLLQPGKTPKAARKVNKNLGLQRPMRRAPVLFDLSNPLIPGSRKRVRHFCVLLVCPQRRKQSRSQSLVKGKRKNSCTAKPILHTALTARATAFKADHFPEMNQILNL